MGVDFVIIENVDEYNYDYAVGTIRSIVRSFIYKNRFILGLENVESILKMDPYDDTFFYKEDMIKMLKEIENLLSEDTIASLENSFTLEVSKEYYIITFKNIRTIFEVALNENKMILAVGD